LGVNDTTTNPWSLTTLERVARGSRDPDDFVSVAIAGEALRRSILLWEPCEKSGAALEVYDEYLADYQGTLPSGVEAALKGVLEDFGGYLRLEQAERSFLEGELLLSELDQVMSVVVAMARVHDRRSLELVIDLEGLETWRLGDELAQFAEDHELVYAPDPDFPEAFGWWEELAWRAPSRKALVAVVRSEARRKRILEQAMAHFDEKHGL